MLWVVSMGEVACCEEIKGFIAKYNIKQQQIASLAGIITVFCLMLQILFFALVWHQLDKRLLY